MTIYSLLGFSSISNAAKGKTTFLPWEGKKKRKEGKTRKLCFETTMRLRSLEFQYFGATSSAARKITEWRRSFGLSFIRISIWTKPSLEQRARNPHSILTTFKQYNPLEN